MTSEADVLFYKNFVALDKTNSTEEALQKQYNYTADNYFHAKLEYDLLDEIRKDPLFERKSPLVKALIKSQYAKRTEFLLFNAEGANLADKWEYQKRLREINPQKEQVLASTEPTTVEEKCNTAANEFLNGSGRYNLFRLSYVFSRNTLRALLSYLAQVVSTLYRYVNIAILEIPTLTFNLMSVLLFAAQLLVDGIEIFRHKFLPTETEKTYENRATLEFWKRYTRIINALWWATFNLITNFPYLFSIAPGIADWILTGVLFFDVLFLLVILKIELGFLDKNQQWLAKQTREEIQKVSLEDLEREITQAKSYLSENEKNELSKINEEQMRTAFLEMYEPLAEKNLCHKAADTAKLCLFIAATLLFIASLALVLSVASPITAAIGFFACVIAVSMILSGNNFAAFVSARTAKILEQEKSDKSCVGIRQKAENQKLTEFYKSIAEHIIMPMLIVGLFTINWPAALAVLLTYIIVKNQSYINNFINDKFGMQNGPNKKGGYSELQNKETTDNNNASMAYTHCH
ncbi:MAG: hypothetical protein A3E88_01955 [Legionellales bacterium RIFCSPHIGHO2_12_FULL_35_11]|nr:MAG: hypothetical protein A3E88_01955 [Legionellales bacterium RIFCSPHIGHO2_12_FULL_35_11]